MICSSTNCRSPIAPGTLAICRAKACHAACACVIEDGSCLHESLCVLEMAKADCPMPPCILLSHNSALMLAKPASPTTTAKNSA